MRVTYDFKVPAYTEYCMLVTAMWETPIENSWNVNTEESLSLKYR